MLAEPSTIVSVLKQKNVPNLENVYVGRLSSKPSTDEKSLYETLLYEFKVHFQPPKEDEEEEEDEKVERPNKSFNTTRHVLLWLALIRRLTLDHYDIYNLSPSRSSTSPETPSTTRTSSRSAPAS